MSLARILLQICLPRHYVFLSLSVSKFIIHQLAQNFHAQRKSFSPAITRNERKVTVEASIDFKEAGHQRKRNISSREKTKQVRFVISFLRQYTLKTKNSMRNSQKPRVYSKINILRTVRVTNRIQKKGKVERTMRTYLTLYMYVKQDCSKFNYITAT